MEPKPTETSETNNTTLIRISLETKETLNALKVHEKQSYDEILKWVLTALKEQAKSPQSQTETKPQELTN